MKFSISFVVAVAAFLSASGARAAEPQPGLWEVKLKIDLPEGKVVACCEVRGETLEVVHEGGLQGGPDVR